MRASSTRRTALGVSKIGRVGLKSLVPLAGALLLAPGFVTEAEAKTPGKTYCFYGKCHRVKTIAETQALVGKEETLMASHYDSCKRDRYNPCGLTSSGEKFNPAAADNAASPIYPDGTTLLVWSPETRASIVLRINNAGPYWGNRRLDVSRKAAEKLGFGKRGVAKLKVRVIGAPTAAEARYKRNRKYDPVPGYIGKFASLDEAQAGAVSAYMVAGLTSPFPAPTKVADGAPTQVARAAEIERRVAEEAPIVLAAVEAAPSEQAAAVVTAAAVVPAVKADSSPAVAATDAPELVATDVPEARTVQVARADAKPQRTRSHAERTATKNSRSYRVAARKKKQEPVARQERTAVAVAAAQAATREDRRPKGRRPVTRDGTNDMSMFSRHVYAGMERLAAQEPMRRRPAYSSLGYGRGDEG